MQIIGLTGNYGMGKSTVARLFKELGAVTIDTDAIVRSMLDEPSVIDEIRNKLGDSVMTSGALNKQIISDMVFGNRDMRIALEDIIHPKVFRKIKDEIDRIDKEDAVVIVEAPILFERGYESRFDKTVTVYTPEETAISRLMVKGISEADARKRLASQLPINVKTSRSDYIIDNSKELDFTKKQVKEIFSKLYHSASSQ